MTMDRWIDLLNSVGLPTVFVLALLIMIWRSLNAVAPFLQEAYRKHIELVEELRSSVSKQTDLLATIHEESKRSNLALRHAADALEEIATPSRKGPVADATGKMRDELESS